MLKTHSANLHALLSHACGSRRAEALLATLEVPLELRQSPLRSEVSRAEIAMALAARLLDDVTRRVPLARAYVLDAVREGRRITFDHGAVRTVNAACGELPGGIESLRRILEPLGFRQAGVYPLERLKMTGYAFAHADLPAGIPQYFVSEFHPEQCSAPVQSAIARVVGNSRDPLSDEGRARLAELSERYVLPLGEACALLPELVGCFDRQHDEPRLSDYECIAAESDEMAWIATEGQSFNHATDRVADVQAVAEDQRRLGRPIKERLEVSSSGRVIQTAFRAAQVERLFVTDDGEYVVREVPGSFHEFISREALANGALDLSFDSGNAQSIFRMTSRGAEQ